MAGKNDMYKYGKDTRFSSTNQPPNRGRKPKLYTIANKVYNISREEWNKVKLFLLQCTSAEIEKIIENEDTPMWVLILCRGLKRDAAKGITFVLNDMEDRLFGRAPGAPEGKEDIPHTIVAGINVEDWIKKEIEIKNGVKNDNES